MAVSETEFGRKVTIEEARELSKTIGTLVWWRPQRSETDVKPEEAAEIFFEV